MSIITSYSKFETRDAGRQTLSPKHKTSHSLITGRDIHDGAFNPVITITFTSYSSPSNNINSHQHFRLTLCIFTLQRTTRSISSKRTAVSGASRQAPSHGLRGDKTVRIKRGIWGTVYRWVGIGSMSSCLVPILKLFFFKQSNSLH